MPITTRDAREITAAKHVRAGYMASIIHQRFAGPTLSGATEALGSGDDVGAAIFIHLRARSNVRRVCRVMFRQKLNEQQSTKYSRKSKCNRRHRVIENKGVYLYVGRQARILPGAREGTSA